MKSLRAADKATNRGVRVENTRLILQCIGDGNGTVSRADLIRLTGLNTGTVSSVVAGLCEQRLVREVGVGASIGGKPPTLLDLDESAHVVLGVHVARSEYRIATVSLRGKILEQDIGQIEPDDVVEAVVGAIERMTARAGCSVLAAGVAVPGVVDAGGRISRSVTMSWSNLDLQRQLGERLKFPVYLINDSDACALAEVALSDDKTASLMALYVGDGVGAGLVLSGSLFHGDDFTAGEVGHINLRTHDLQCECGRRGCLEASARISVLTGRPQSWEVGPGTAPVGSLDKRAARRAARNIAALLELVFELIDVRRTVICGPVCAYGTQLLDYIREALESNELYTIGDLVVENSVLSDAGALLGAAATATHQEIGLL
jgi:predicted NBD/HSP70 family sugar kinase